MTEFNIRTDSVDVEQIMRQIRARIKEKRGVDYTEQQIQELANVKLQRFLDPKGVRSDLVEQFKRTRDTTPDPFEPQQYAFEDVTLYYSHRGIVRFVRRLLNPILKLFFNPNPLIEVLHRQTELNLIYANQFGMLRDKNQQRNELDALYYELVHNLVLELTRVSIETKNLKMRLESLSSRMDFDERRARALEGAVQYKPGTGSAREPQRQAPPSRAPEPQRQQPQRQPPREPRPQPQYQPPPQAEIQPRPAGQGADAGMSGAGVSEQPVDSAAAGTAGTGAPNETDASGAPGTARRRRRRRRGRRGGRGRGQGVGASPMSATGPATGPDLTPGAQPGHPQQNEFYDSESDADSGSEADEDPEPSE